MKKIIGTVFLFFNIVFLFAQDPQKQNLSDLATITFPQKPVTLDTLGHNTAQFIDSTSVYSTLTREISPDQLLQVSSDKIPEFYEGTIKGFLGAAQGKLVSKKTFEIDGLEGVDIEFITTANPSLPDLRFVRLILLNNTLIVVNFMTLSENKHATLEARTQFFNSLTITADKTTLTQGTENPLAYAVGSILGKLTAWAIILGIIAGVVLLIRKITTRKKTIKKTEY